MAQARSHASSALGGTSAEYEHDLPPIAALQAADTAALEKIEQRPEPVLAVSLAVVVGRVCLNPAAAFPGNPNVHCFPPAKLEAVVAGTAVSALLVAFASPDVNAVEGPFLGTEHMLRADHFHNQPCPTDPPGETRRPPLYEWRYLGPRFGWDYYICHHFDRPW